tara:strand:- start:2176 stop:2622 length:447 start_codon:yes stop_codon:yes gene_type:complete
MSAHAIRGHFKIKGKKHYYISQKELADGWRKILPKRNMVPIQEYNNENNENEKENKVKENKIIYNEVTLAQFPPYLYKYLDESKDIYFDNFFKFRLIKTDQDDLILDLYKKLCKKYPNEKEKNDIYALGQILEINNSSSWITIKASNI